MIQKDLASHEFWKEMWVLFAIALLSLRERLSQWLRIGILDGFDYVVFWVGFLVFEQMTQEFAFHHVYKNTGIQNPNHFCSIWWLLLDSRLVSDTRNFNIFDDLCNLIQTGTVENIW